MRLITGDELGLLKEVIPELCRPPPTDASGLPLQTPSWMGNVTQTHRPRPSATSIQAAANLYNGLDTSGAVQRLENGEVAMTRDRGLIALSFVKKKSNGSDAFQFAALRIDGCVEQWSASRDVRFDDEKNSEANVTPARYRIVSSTSNVFHTDKDVNDDSEEQSTGKGWYINPPIRPIGMVSTTSNDNSILAAADSSGNISIINDSCKVISRYHAFDESREGAVLSYTKGGFANNHIATCIGVGGDRVAVGGRERGVRVLDLETGKGIWKAKNMPPDPQTLLQQPLWTTALQFIDSPHNSSNGTNQSSSFSNLLASGTAYKQIQIYDVRASSSTDSAQGVMRRPVLHTPENLLQHRVTSLLQLPNTNQLLVADAIGDCHILDMRKFHSGKQSTYKKQKQSHSSQEIGLGRLVGPGGSVRQLALHPTLPLVACVGLDRKLWTWDVNTKRMIDCIYLRQRLNCLLVCEDEGWNGGDENGAGDARLSSEIDGWEEEGDDLVQDYVDSDEENVEMEEETDSNETSGSSSDDTESESDEESGSSAEKNANTNEYSSDKEESDTPPPNQKQSSKSGHPKKKQKNY